jgi:uncharacterized protein YdaU (DUF1376 family)
MYVSDWVRSETRIKLSSAGRGMFRELLDYCWIEGTLPNEPRALRSISGGTEKEFAAEWPIIEKCFTVDGDRLRHWKVDDKRPELVSYQQQRSAAGRASVEARRQRKLNNRSTSVQTSDGTSVQTDTPVSLKPSLSVSLSSSVPINKTPPPARATREFEPFDGADPTTAVHRAIEECAQFWPNIGDKRFAKATWEREASRSTKGAEAWCAAIVATARIHAEALIEAKRSDPRKFIPTLDKWVSSGDYTSPPPMVISTAKKASRYELPEDANAN